MYGIFEKSPMDYTKEEYSEIESKLSTKRRKRHINLSKVGKNLVGNVTDFPWEW